MKRTFSLPLLALAGVLVLPGLASAHIIPGSSHDLQHGFAHPFTGLDHLMAMLAVGLWAAQHRGRALWLIPLTFVSVMALGGVLGIAGASLPGVEFGIALSVLVLGALIATATCFKPSWSMLVAGMFALCHGFAHGREMPASTGALSFSLGFILSTLLLHGMGMSLGLYLQKQPRMIRLAGGAMALSSLCFFLSL